MIFLCEHGASVTSLIERRTRIAVLFEDRDRRSKPLMERLIDIPAPGRQSTTFDRGFESTSRRQLEAGMGTDAWFRDPQAHWQKGSGETSTGRSDDTWFSLNKADVSDFAR